eukprot:CAMPEP_0172699998 /NCGR_PEP_ID=MMETSP1074-20121228/30591_1 /TAXON_ID=2916 /ORGANISM="Ceratium fusus, Strain PA161109" /LENGTH=145 /DNA_ID=CAMNT_0013521299 /DNA_START=123 /DNA_END=560 /DNA_ORIENTATION=+
MLAGDGPVPPVTSVAAGVWSEPRFRLICGVTDSTRLPAGDTEAVESLPEVRRDLAFNVGCRSTTVLVMSLDTLSRATSISRRISSTWFCIAEDKPFCNVTSSSRATGPTLSVSTKFAIVAGLSSEPKPFNSPMCKNPASTKSSLR